MKSTKKGAMRKLLGTPMHKAVFGKPVEVEGTAIKFCMSVKSTNDDKHIVTGEVYAPNVIDTHGEMMEAEDVEFLAHSFMQLDLAKAIDLMHDNKSVDCTVLESFVAKGHPEYNEGAWVLSIRINDDKVWKRAKKGDLGGYSVEARVHKVDAVAEIESRAAGYGFTEEQDGHRHAYFVVLDELGIVKGGFTSFDDGHRHIIKYGTRTEMAEDHAHRMFLK